MCIIYVTNILKYKLTKLLNISHGFTFVKCLLQELNNRKIEPQ